jgi:hypothetical protein
MKESICDLLKKKKEEQLARCDAEIEKRMRESVSYVEAEAEAFERLQRANKILKKK